MEMIGIYVEDFDIGFPWFGMVIYISNIMIFITVLQTVFYPCLSVVVTEW